MVPKSSRDALAQEMSAPAPPTISSDGLGASTSTLLTPARAPVVPREGRPKVRTKTCEHAPPSVRSIGTAVTRLHTPGPLAGTHTVTVAHPVELMPKMPSCPKTGYPV